MIDFLRTTQAQVVVLLALLAMLCAVGFYTISRFRGGWRRPEGSGSELMTNFRQLHDQGELSDEEYRTIKSMLASKVLQETERKRPPD